MAQERYPHPEDAYLLAPSKSLEALSREQGVEPIAREEDLICQLWPVEESLEEFLETLRSWRAEGPWQGLRPIDAPGY